MRDCMEQARKAWNGVPPAWIVALASMCQTKSLRSVAAELAVSPALISLGLRNKHHASLSYLQQKVEACVDACIACPILGNITRMRCAEEHEKPFCSANPLRVQLFRACRVCKQNDNL